MLVNGYSQSFRAKKQTILQELSNVTETTYEDNSPKGTVDVEILDLIDELNSFEGYVTTSSCAGRIAVFVEGKKTAAHDITDIGITPSSTLATKTAGPGGKGHGNKWLYVSHSPLDLNEITDCHELLGLTSAELEAELPIGNDVRLIKLSFSPLILHVLCATLRDAKPLLTAAINAGFRESGVQSLKALDDANAGVMLGIRTAGIAFESVVGHVVEHADGEEGYVSVLNEKVLRLLLDVANARFEYNVERRERLRGELRKFAEINAKNGEWEDENIRREKKRAEGLRRRKEVDNLRTAGMERAKGDVLEDGLGFDIG
ncbi:hypothetical protein BT93_L4197 [Corymbia citriodora subsp. variegata]|uniref:tRNA(Phe) 7-[(3-amino-3-carboxypropyl)-4-demethylwyosine(37)-N(4)]-methyltransferase n=1 Tax=Corymbia citriodora subsp. variegata TaxID=360336 RepID=A0A8T0CG94_CORYI|nr:hypothetical protein BT93_L4197 [Corymbia citriodora subsp. variegata]